VSENQEPSVYDVLVGAIKNFLKSFGHRSGAVKHQENTAAPTVLEVPLAIESAPVVRSTSSVSTDKASLAAALSHALRTPDEPEFAFRAGSVFNLSFIQTTFWLPFVVMLALVIGFRFYGLDNLQAEIYGDIATVYNYALNVLLGNWPVDFVLSAGPLYHYLIAPVLMVLGLTYWGLKVSSVLTSLLALVFTYLFARELIGDRFATLATAIAGVSSWLLIFSRLGNFPIVLPLIVMATLWLLIRFVLYRQTAILVACAFVASLGWYAYPQTYILPFTILITLFLLRLAGNDIRARDMLVFFIVAMVCTVPFIFIVAKSPENFVSDSGYIGGKLLGVESPLKVFGQNVLRALGAFNISGDAAWRGNPLRLPHLDFISGILFLVGFVYWLAPARRRWFPALIVPFLLLQLPSMLVLASPQEVPSAARTLGVAPIAYILVAGGLWLILKVLAGAGHVRWSVITGIIVFSLIVWSNGIRYFQDYLSNLPYNNTPIARLVAGYADTLPPDTNVYLVDCCWDNGMPEPMGIRYAMQRPENLIEISSSDLTCDSLDYLKHPAVLIWNRHNALPAEKLSTCPQFFAPQLHVSSVSGNEIFNSSPLLSPDYNSITIAPLVSQTQEPGVPSDVPESLLYTPLEYKGQEIIFRYAEIDMGQPADVFDGNVETLMRGAGANPYIMEMIFPKPINATTLELTLYSMPRFNVNVVVVYEDGTQQNTLMEYANLPLDPKVTIELPKSDKLIKTVHIEIEDIRARPGEGFHMHVRELNLY
jgi:4-amino-4-deoxy-L-arabinose transferase-like glycosyltransferase